MLNTIIPYFNLCYGEKYMAGRKLVDIRALIISGERDALALAILTMYSLAITGTSRNLSLRDQCSVLGLSVPLLELPYYADNHNLPTFPL